MLPLGVKGILPCLVMVISALVTECGSHTEEEDSGHFRYKRKAVADDSHLWPNGTIYYTIRDDVAASELSMGAIVQALEHWEQTTCIRFIYVRPNDTQLFLHGQKYVQFVDGKGCHSSVGRGTGTEPQDVSIGKGCAFAEKMIHELGHLVGLWHEHARLDRDGNVVILWNNVKPNMSYNFIKMPIMRLLAPYDLSSMMHYDRHTFSANGHPTIRAVDPKLGFLIGYRPDLSFYDIHTANQLYKCAEHCDPKTAPRCDNDGFLLENCTCKCPRGLTGADCNTVITDKDCGGLLYVKKSAVLSSPGYPFKYGHNQRCNWLIKSPTGTVMKFELLYIDVEQTKDKLCRDELEVRYHHMGIEKGPIFCGTNITDTDAVSTTNRLLIHFASNNRVAFRGFKALITVLPRKDCASSPCQNNGICHDIREVNGYVCQCFPGWVGPNCEIHVVDGGLSSWTDWSSCESPCGIRVRTRDCNNPVPENGGRDCRAGMYETSRCGDAEACKGSFYCNFGDGLNTTACDIYQEEEVDKLNWSLAYSQTPSLNTGPSRGHSTGNVDDMYIYLEASMGEKYDDAIMWFPSQKWKLGTYCLQFFFTMFGESVATLAVVRRWTGIKTFTSLWQISGNQGPQWNVANVNLLLYRNVEIGILAFRGEGYDSDIALDDISISPGSCVKNSSQSIGNKYGCDIEGGGRRPVGHYTVKEGECFVHTCFCNQNGNIDCPQWMSTDICSEEKETMVIKRPKNRWGSRSKSKQVISRPKPTWIRKNVNV